MIISIITMLAFMGFAPTSLAGEEKVRIAIVDFDTDAIRGHWHYGWSYQNLERAAADNLTTELAKLSRENGFTIIERQQLDKVLSEQNLGAAGRIDPSTAARIGKVLGAQVIVVGSVEMFTVTETKGRIPGLGKWKYGRGIGGKVVTSKCKLNARLIDTTTAEILGAYEGEGDKKHGGGSFAGASLDTTWNAGLASKVLAEAIDSLAQGIAEDVRNIKPSSVRGGLEGKVAKVGGNKLFINIGSDKGLRVGDRFEVRSVGEQIIDPDTGEVLGGVEETIGIIEVTKILAGKLAEAKVVEGAGFAVGNRIIMK